MEHVGYHGTTSAFSQFSEEMFGSASDRSPNGALGAVWSRRIWLASILMALAPDDATRRVRPPAPFA